MPNLTGQSIGRYHILEQLGEGGMATVYKAYDTRLERNVAFKVLRTDQFGSAVIEQILKRFEREAKSLAKLSHSNIVNIHDYGEYEGNPYLVMEYLPGGTLKQKLGRAISWQEAIQIMLPVARGLAYAHQHNVIHRDVKPANILMKEGDVPVLTDFGIAKLLEGVEGHTLTASGVGIGTPEYMAPEQGIGASTIDARADIYSLGIVLYEMVTGRKPYIADTPMAVVLKQMTDPLPRPTDFVPNLPEEVEHILFKALAKQPDDRYADMRALIIAMEDALAETKKVKVPVATPTQSPAKPKKKKTAQRARPSPKTVMTVIGALAVILLLVVGVPWVLNQLSAATEPQTISTRDMVNAITSTDISLPSTKTTIQANTPSSSMETPPSPTRASIPTNTAPAQSNEVIDFILSYILENPPTFEDDFSSPDMVWGGTSEGLAIYPLVRNGVLTITDHICETCIGMGPDHFVSGTALPINGLLDSENFALQFNFSHMSVNSIAVQFRSCEFSISNNGTWTLFDTSETQKSRVTGGYTNLSYQKTPLLIIVHNENLAVYLNNKMLYTSREILLTGSKNRIIAMGNQGSSVVIDDVEFFDLGKMEYSAQVAPGSTPAWVTDFAQPILDAIASRPPDFEDDFHDTSGGWHLETWVACGEWRMNYVEGELVQTVGVTPGTAVGVNQCRVHRNGIDYTNFVVELDGRFLPNSMEDSNWSIDFRSSEGKPVRHQFRVNNCGGIDIMMFNGGGQGFSLADRPGNQTNHLLLIAKGSKFGFYVNGQPLYFIEDDSISYGDIFLAVDIPDPTLGDAIVAFDNFKIWDLDKVPNLP